MVTRQRSPSRAAATTSARGLDARPAFPRVERVEHDEPRVVDPAVGIFERHTVPIAQRQAGLIQAQIEPPRARQKAAGAQMIVEEKPRAQLPGRPQIGPRGQHEAQRTHEMGRDGPQRLALRERRAHEAQRAMFEIAQPAVDELGRGRRRAPGQIALLE